MTVRACREPVDAYLETEDGEIHYFEWDGDGPQTHLLHANGFCAGTYAPFVEHLCRDLHVVASDGRGHGDSRLPAPMPLRDWRIFAEDLRRLITTRMKPPVIGIGHSLGAVVTYLAAARYPDLFSAIVLIEPVFLSRRYLWSVWVLHRIGRPGRLPLARQARRRRSVFTSKQEALERFTAGRGMFKTWSPEFIDAYLGCALLERDDRTAVLKCDPELEAQIFESVPVNVWSYARRLRCPVLAVRGEHSNTFMPASARRLKRLVADIESATVPGAGHFAPMEKPDALAAIIRDFIARRI